MDIMKWQQFFIDIMQIKRTRGTNEKMFYEKTWFKNLIVIGIPAVISVIGVLISIIGNNTIKISFIIFSIISFLVLIAFMVYYSKQDDMNEEKIRNLEKENQDMKVIINHLELENRSNMQTINTISSFTEIWARNINAFANDVQRTGTALVKYWDKALLYDSVCEKCRDTIEAYVGSVDHTKISVGFIEYSINDDKEEWVAFIAHSNPESTRPRAFDKREKLTESIYHYAQLMRDKNSDIEVASNNEEILRIFKPVSTGTDLTKYTQYIAIPVFCSKKKMLGVFQIVTKHGYVIIDDKVGLKSYAESNLIPFSNLIVLIDKIGKGLYAKPMKSGDDTYGKK
jgi:hypothetical protein